MTFITVKVDRAKLDARLAALGKAESYQSRLLAPAARAIKTRIDLGFKNSVDPWGQPWAPLKCRDGKPLRDTGVLQSSISTNFGQSGNKSWFVIGTNRTVSWRGVSWNLGSIHQYGATVVPRPDNKKGLLRFSCGGSTIYAKKSVIPARAFLPLRPYDILDLPPSWALAAREATRRAFGEVFR